MDLSYGFVAAVVAESLVLSAIFKYQGSHDFSVALRSYTALDRLPSSVIRGLGILVPTAEVGSAVAIWFPTSRHLGLLAATALVTGFTVVLVADKRPTIASCGCWGSANLEVPRAAYIVRNLLLLALAAFGVLLAWTANPLSGQPLYVVSLLAIPFSIILLELPQILHVATVANISFTRPSRS